MIFIDTLGRFWGPEFQPWGDIKVNECDLEGVACVDGKVVKVDLTNAAMCSDGNRKAGPISYCVGLPAEIGKLSSLEVLQLSRQQFLRGSIPSDVGMLSNLKFLDLSGCMALTGTLPSELGLLSDLRLLKIIHTRIHGTIPSELFVLKSLEILHLTNNHLTGTLPAARLESVKELMIARNSLTGSLPSQIGKMKKLENLELYYNRLGGGIPSSIGRCSLLKRIGTFCLLHLAFLRSVHRPHKPPSFRRLQQRIDWDYS
jgi:hypothetical protein